MLDIRLFRENLAQVKANLEKRHNPELLKKADDAANADRAYLDCLRDVEQLRRQRNEGSELVAKLKRDKTKAREADETIERVRKLNLELAQKEIELDKWQQRIRDLLFSIPNLLDDSVPLGKDDSENVQIRTRGTPRKDAVKGHEELAAAKGWLDIGRAGKVAGARFYYLKGDLAILDLALQRFALDLLMKKGFVPVIPPYLMRRELYEGVTSLEEFEKVLYRVDTSGLDEEEGKERKPENDLFLIATSEHPMAAMHANEVLPESTVALKFAGVSPCFRKEAGSHGKDTKGIFRVHQFHKVEQFVFCDPSRSWEEFEHLIKNTEELFQALQLPYRIVNVCTGDIGTIAAKKYDLEVWMPAQKQYREAASCSNCTDYQARRLGIRYGTEGEKPKGYAHTLNNTAVATTRALVAILETHQQPDGSVRVPDALVPYVGKKRLE